jgi:hypothetical protein
MVILEETFPRTKESGTTNLGVIVDEFGLIRGLKAITDRKDDLLQFLRSVFTVNFKPLYFNIEGALKDLKELSESFPSLQDFYEKTAKFVGKYIEIWNLQMELGFKKGLPTTSNEVESKNSLFKVFIRKAKCFESNATWKSFSGLWL